MHGTFEGRSGFWVKFLACPMIGKVFQAFCALKVQLAYTARGTFCG